MTDHTPTPDASGIGERLHAAKREIQEYKRRIANLGVTTSAIEAERDQFRAVLQVIAQETALSAETHRLIAQDVLGGFVERGER